MMVALVGGCLPPPDLGFEDLSDLMNIVRPGELENDIEWAEHIGSHFCIVCLICGEVMFVWQQNEQIAADSLPIGPMFEMIWHDMARHLLGHCCHLSRPLGPSAYCGPCFPCGEECAINYMGEPATLEEQAPNENLNNQYLGTQNWWDMYQAMLAQQRHDGLWGMPAISRKEHLRLKLCSKLWERSGIIHAMKCDRCVFTVIYSRLVFDVNKLLSRLDCVLRLATTPPRDAATRSVQLTDVLDYILGPLLAIYAREMADAHNTIPEVVFGQLYLWLLHGTEGRDPKDLNAQRLFEVVIGQYCGDLFKRAMSDRVKELRDMAAELLRI